MFGRVVGLLLILVVAVYARNASWLAPSPAGAAQLIAHRGVHQTYHRDGLTNDTCTAMRIDPPQHQYLENTLGSMSAAFEAGASVVELDIHPTTDGHHAVFHDWTLDCRTNGTGRTRDHRLAHLQTLDIGYGYTADGGKTYPFRGDGVGLMPSLAEVFIRFPDRQFLINLKSNDAPAGNLFADALDQHPEWRSQIWAVNGGPKTNAAILARHPDLIAFDRVTTKACLKSYVTTGWSGAVPAACQNTVLMLPISHRGLMWGWPNAFLARMAAADTEVVLLGPYTQGDPGTTGVDAPELLRKIPPQYSGFIWTNKIEQIGPAVLGEDVGVDIDGAADGGR